MPDRVLGEKGCAFVLAKGNQNLTLCELNLFLREKRHIATYKLPERLELVQSLPMTKISKIDKNELRRIIVQKLLIESDRSGFSIIEMPPGPS